MTQPPQAALAVQLSTLSFGRVRRLSMSIPSEVLESFSAGTRTDAVPFVANDPVRIVSGSNKKRTGVVISIFSLEPVTTYLIEPDIEPWGDFQAGPSDLELIEP